MISLAVDVGGQALEGYLLAGTLSISDQAQSRSVASMRFEWADGNALTSLGEKIEIRADGTLIFAGVIDDLRDREDDLGRVLSDVSAVDYTALLDRHLVSFAWDNALAGDIVRDIAGDSNVSSLHLEGLTVTGVDDGPVLEAVSFNYVPASRALEELAEFAGFTWTVRPDKGLVFQARDAQAAPFSIQDAGTNYTGISTTREKHKYRNRQFLRAGKDLTASRTDTFQGDGTNKTFTCAFPVGKVPTVEVNSVAQSVGIRGLDTGQDFYWSKGDHIISQDDSGTPLGSGDTLDVTYQGLFPILVRTDNEAAQGQRATAEGTSGLYSAVHQDASIDRRGVAIVRAESLLSVYGKFQATVDVTTDSDAEPQVASLQAGDILTIEKPSLGLTGGHMVESVRLDMSQDGRWLASISALSGQQTMAWLDYWRELSKAQQGLVERENEVVVLGGGATSLADNVDMTDTLVPTDAAPETRVGFVQVDFGEVG